jgi:hypothetical protein
MTQARDDAVADFCAAAFDTIDDPASTALLDLLVPAELPTPTCPLWAAPAPPRAMAWARPPSTR